MNLRINIYIFFATLCLVFLWTLPVSAETSVSGLTKIEQEGTTNAIRITLNDIENAQPMDVQVSSSGIEINETTQGTGVPYEYWTKVYPASFPLCNESWEISFIIKNPEGGNVYDSGTISIYCKTPPSDKEICKTLSLRGGYRGFPTTWLFVGGSEVRKISAVPSKQTKSIEICGERMERWLLKSGRGNSSQTWMAGYFL